MDALLETIDAFSSVSGTFTGGQGSSLSGAIDRVHLASHPVLALAALLFAVIG